MDTADVELLLTYSDDSVVRECFLEAYNLGVSSASNPQMRVFSSKVKLPYARVLATLTVTQSSLPQDWGKVESLVLRDVDVVREIVDYLGWLNSRWGRHAIPDFLANTDLSRFPSWEPTCPKHNITMPELVAAAETLTLASTDGQYVHHKRVKEFRPALIVEYGYPADYRFDDAYSGNKKTLSSQHVTFQQAIRQSPVLEHILVKYVKYVKRVHGLNTATKEWLMWESTAHKKHGYGYVYRDDDYWAEFLEGKPKP